MSRNPELYLTDIRQSCRKIFEYIQGLDFASFCQDQKTYDAVVRNLEIIGEAAKHLSDEVRAKYPSVEWKKISGLRDVIAHAYFGIDNVILWDIIQTKVPELILSLAAQTQDRGRA